MKKILFYTMTMKRGGTEKTIATLANHFIKTNEVIIVTNIKCKPEYKLDKRIKFHSIDNVDKSNENTIKKIITKTSNYRSKKLLNIINTYKPDIIYCMLPEPTIRILRLKKKKKINCKIITAVRNDPKHEFNIPLKNTIRNHYYKYNDLIIFQNKKYIERFPKYIKEKSIVIKNMIPDKIDNIKRNKIEDKIVAVGRLEKQKNYLLLIKAFSIISKNHKNIKLEIYGKGKEKKKIKKEIKKYKLKDKITIYENEKEILKKIENAYLYVLASKYEGISNSLLEALFLNLPVVVTNSSNGIKELIEDNGLGVLSKNNDLNDLVKNIEFALNKNNNKLLRKKSEKIKDIINNKEILDQWEMTL